jgi:hypothetical protein
MYSGSLQGSMYEDCRPQVDCWNLMHRMGGSDNSVSAEIPW